MGWTLLRGVIWVVAVAAALGLGAGFFGAWHPLADSFAVLRLPFAVTVLLCGMALRRLRAVRAGLVALAVVAAAPLGLSKIAVGTPGAVVIYNKNMFYRNGDLPGLAQDIRLSGAEVVTLQEVSSRNLALFDQLRDLYPHQVRCPNRDWNGIAILSRYPFMGELRCTGRRAAAAAQVDHPEGGVWIVSVHYSWPWPYPQGESADLVAGLVAELTGPVVIAGDFNTVPWAATVGRVVRGAGGQVIGPRHTTLVLRGLAPFPSTISLPLAGSWSGGGSLGPITTAFWAA